MNIAPAAQGLRSASSTQPLLSRNAFAALVIAVCAGAASAWAVPGVMDATTVLVRGVFNNKVLWVCLGIATWHLLRTPSPTVGGTHLAAAVPALVLAATASGIWPWIGLTLSLAMMLTATPGMGSARTGLMIALVAALHEIAISILGELTGDAVLSADARVVGALANWLMPELEVEGNALQMPGGHMVILVWGCSSLTNLGDALLLFWALASLQVAGRSTLRWKGGKFLTCMIFLTGAIITLNALRLMLMTADPEMFSYLHGNEGSVWFRLVTLGLTAMMSMWAGSK